MTETVGRPILADYCRAGWALVPIPPGQKGPVASGWNTREMCVTEPEVAQFLDGNVGLAHAYSGTCAIDIDDFEAVNQFLSERGIDLSELMEADDAVAIVSRPGRAKLLYRLPKPLPSFKLPCKLELRCGTTNNKTVQDVLPPSIHPDTGKPYTWKLGLLASFESLPVLPPQLYQLWASLIAPVGKPPRSDSPAARAIADALPELRAVLARTDPDVDYDVPGGWLQVGAMLHHETQGRPEGLELWNTWSSKGKKYKGLADLELHWRSFRLDHPNPITLGSFRVYTPSTADDFDDVSGQPVPERQQVLTGTAREEALRQLRSVKRTNGGIIEARISNITAVLSVPEVSGYDLALDTFQDAVMLSPHESNEWRPFTDNDYTQLRVWAETVGNCLPIPHAMMREAVHLVAEQQKMDTAQVWLEGLQWDGKPRVDDFCAKYWGVRQSDYARAVSAYIWTALAGRVADPGCQCDMVPVLVGDQGIGKSRGVQALVPAPEHFVELRLDEGDDVIARKMRGALVAELAEMRGLRGAEIERVKAFITRTHEKWVPKYKEFSTTYPRRFLIIGTTNDEEFLPIDTEHRRWLPLESNGVNVDKIKADRDQLWAEGYTRFILEGVAWQRLDELAADARQRAQALDTWENSIRDWVGEHEGTQLHMADILSQAVGLDLRTSSRAHELRVGRILRSLGYFRRTIRHGKAFQKVWMKEQPPVDA